MFPKPYSMRQAGGRVQAKEECWILQVTGTRRWIHDLGLPILTTWRPWHSASGQVGALRAGFFVQTRKPTACKPP
jgi:hypothetical protein